ncbi:MAG: hypothetical protein JW791_03490 [Nanoarchaeota archaeon]|nr:hypothetical protein [Nanoarchaeota archaeon]
MQERKVLLFHEKGLVLNNYIKRVIERTCLFGREEKANSDPKLEFLEFLIQENNLDVLKDFGKIQELMHYKKPVYLINLLKNNPSIVSEDELEELVIKYTGDASGVGNSAKLEKFKLLLKKYDPNNQLSIIMSEMGYSKTQNFMNYFYFALKSDEELRIMLDVSSEEYGVQNCINLLTSSNFSHVFKSKAQLEREEKVLNYLRKTKFERLDFLKLMPIADYKMPVYLSYFLRDLKDHDEEKISELLLQYEKFELRNNIGQSFYRTETNFNRFKELFPDEPLPGPLLQKARRLRNVIKSRKRTDLTPRKYLENYKQQLRYKLKIKTWEEFEELLRNYSEIIFQ